MTARLLTLALLLATPSAAANRPPRVAVFELELRNLNLKTSMARLLRDYLSDRLAATGKYHVVPGAKTRAALTREQARSRKASFDRKRQIRVGKALAADMSLSTRVMRIGQNCTVTSTLYNLETQLAETGASESGPCDEESLQWAIERVVYELTEGSRAVEPPPLPKPSPASKTGQEHTPAKPEANTPKADVAPESIKEKESDPIELGALLKLLLLWGVLVLITLEVIRPLAKWIIRMKFGPSGVVLIAVLAVMTCYAFYLAWLAVMDPAQFESSFMSKVRPIWQ